MISTDTPLSSRHPILRIAASIAIALMALACDLSATQDQDSGPPSANFDQDKTSGGPGLVVQFTDTSTGDIDAYDWDFGNLGTRTERDPRVQFDAVGTYSVTLKASGPEGVSTFEKPMLISVLEPEQADVARFEADRTEGGPGLTVHFTNTSPGDLASHEWDFGAAGTSSERSPTVVFVAVGVYDVSLRVMGSEGEGFVEKESFITVRPANEAGVASFTEDRVEGGPGMTVQFTNTSPGNLTSHEWDFGAAGTSSEKDPIIVFGDVGTYDVSLTVTGTAGAGVVVMPNHITVREAEDAGIAQFSAAPTSGSPGMSVQFSDESTANPGTWDWDFGNGETSDEQNPEVVFATPGSYTVTLTVTGSGGRSTRVETDFIRVFSAPTAGLKCEPSTTFVQNVVTCEDQSKEATSWLWEFGDGSSCFYPAGSEFERAGDATLCVYTTLPGSGTEPDSEGPTHSYEEVGEYVVKQTARGPAGEDTKSKTVAVRKLEIIVTPGQEGLPAPLDVVLTMDTMGVATTFHEWKIDGVRLPTVAASVSHRFKYPGTYTIFAFAGGFPAPVDDTAQIEFVVGEGPLTAAFSAPETEGIGPLEVQFTDESGGGPKGSLKSWLWNFGDGESCFYTTDSKLLPPNGEPDCASSSPRHSYLSGSRYDVSLTVKGTESGSGSDLITSQTTEGGFVTVYIGDPSFEHQTTGQKIGGAWTHLRPASPTESASHVALSDDGALAMPSHGSRWASLDGLGTDGSVAVAELENGIRQDFVLPPGMTVLEFDYALLYAEPPQSDRADAIVATVSDGTGADPVEIQSSKADTMTPYAGQSILFPERDSSIVRSTPQQTASINLEEAFPGSDEQTRFTLTIRTGNVGNDRRSPRAFVDNVRFSEPVPENQKPLDVVFSVDSLVHAGDEVNFEFDDHCANPDDGCSLPTSFRWDFDTQDSVTPPSASGSAEQNPFYIFEEADVYVVSLIAHLGDVEGEAIAEVTVYEKPVANFTISPAEESYIAPVAISFTDTSSADGADPIEMWHWDFVLTESSLQNPQNVLFEKAGRFVVRLTVTTVLGATSSQDLEIVVEAAP